MTQLLVVVMTVVMQSQKSTQKCLTSHPRPQLASITRYNCGIETPYYSRAADLNTSHCVKTFDLVPSAVIALISNERY